MLAVSSPVGGFEEGVSIQAIVEDFTTIAGSPVAVRYSRLGTVVGDWVAYAKPEPAPDTLLISIGGDSDVGLVVVTDGFSGYLRLLRPLRLDGTETEVSVELEVVVSGGSARSMTDASVWVCLLAQEPDRASEQIVAASKTVSLAAGVNKQRIALALPDSRPENLSFVIQFRGFNYSFNVRKCAMFETKQGIPFDEKTETGDGPIPVSTSADHGSKSVSVVVCVHNALYHVRKCLDSLTRYTDIPFSLIVINDGSDEITTRFLKSFCDANPRTIYVRNKEALGYTKSANMGLKRANSDFVVLLNSDTILTSGWLGRMLDCFSRCKSAGIVGPLSNSATWQSIPERTDVTGNWCLNELPAGIDLETYAAAIASKQPALLPSVWLANGFCYMIARPVIDKIGYLDGKSFPVGYGEEDDYSLRAIKAGFSIHIADDTYVYHAKSASFGSERRTAIGKQSKISLISKHGPEYVKVAGTETRFSEDLHKARIGAALAGAAATPAPAHAKHPIAGLRIGWLQPHMKIAGGIRKAVEMTNIMKRLGAFPKIITPSGERPDWIDCQVDILSVDTAKSSEFDLLIFSDPDVMPYVEQIKCAKKVNYHLASYMVYRRDSDLLKMYYSRDDSISHIANSRWTSANLFEHFAIEADQEVFGGAVNRNIFSPRPEARTFDCSYFGGRGHKGGLEIVSATLGLRRLPLRDLNAPQTELASWISKSRVFVSAAWHEGFNLVALEAMACGVPVVMTDDGGSRDYAMNEVNALVVPVHDVPAMRLAINRLLTDHDLRLKLIENGLRTAFKHDWESVTARLASYLANLDRPERT
jgi:GT2 family glycosyltransferase/glycosyltransferase involved in cell wall biosynthesis